MTILTPEDLAAIRKRDAHPWNSASIANGFSGIGPLDRRALLAHIDALTARLEELDGPLLWWCPAWGTLNSRRYHGCDGPDDPNCGKVAYRRAALAVPSAPPIGTDE